MMKVPVHKLYTSEVYKGTDPQLSQAEVYRMKIDEFDPSRNMAVFDIRQIRLDTLYPTCQEIYSDFQILHDTLKSHPRTFELPSWEDPVIVAGSAPLALLEAHLMTCRQGAIHGRWRTRLDSYRGDREGDRFADVADMETILTGNGLFGVKDIDVFIGGAFGQYDDEFRTFVNGFIESLTVKCRERGLRVKAEDYRRNHYIEANDSVLLRDVAIGNRKIKFSLIQYNGYGGIQGVVQRFDIDVCKVMFNPFTLQICADLNVVNAIVNGKAAVCDFFLPRGGPNRYDVNQMCSTLQRMHKYAKRGFSFNRYPKLKMVGFSGRSSPVMVWEDE